MNPIVAHGALINAALFLAGLIVAGVACGNRWTVVLALASAGVASLDYSARLWFGERHAGVWPMIAASNALAVVAAAALVVGYIG